MEGIVPEEDLIFDKNSIEERTINWIFQIEDTNPIFLMNLHSIKIFVFVYYGKMTCGLIKVRQ